MEEAENTGEQLLRTTHYMVVFILLWTVAVGASLFLSIQNHREAFDAEISAQAKTIHAMDMEYRSWAIGHGGVYVPVTDNTPPSEYLAHVPERDITTPSGRKLTLLNSSYITRQVQELMRRHGAAVQSHIASLKPINPVNKADAWEKSALKQFEKGGLEASGIEERDGTKQFRFMKPMITEKSCLKCHAQQGYKVGDVRGGISVSIPLDESLAAMKGEERALMTGHGAVWLLGLAGLIFFGRRQQKAILAAEKSSAEMRLLANSMAQAIYGQDLEGRCIFANAACVRLLGYDSEAELLGRDMHVLMHHTRADGSHYPVEECPTHRSIHESERTHVEDEPFWRRDGSSFPAEYWAYPVEEEGRRHGVVVSFMDISERKAVQEALKVSELQYEALVNRIPVGVYQYRFEPDGNGRFEYVSPRFCEIIGVSEGESLKDPVAPFIAAHPEDLDGLFAANKEAFGKQQPFRWEGRFIVHEEVRWIKIESDPLVLKSGGSVWNGVVSDITEHKLAEIRLRESQAELAEAQRIAHLGSWRMDLATNEVVWSDELYELYGYDPAQPPPLYTESMKLFTPESWERLSAAIAETAETGKPYELELEAVSETGDRKWMLALGELERDEQGKGAGLRGVVMDITERKLASLELTKSQQELAEAQRVAQIGNWELDLVSSQLHWSDEVFEIFEIDKEKFGASYEAFLAAIHPEDRDMVNGAYTESVENHTHYEINHRLLMPDGRIKYVQERCQSFYDEDGKPVRSVGTVQDITHMHEVEEQLRQAQKMEAVGTLVGGIAHDFNNKLAAITGNLYLAQQKVEEGSEAAERLEVVEKLSFEAASMVQQLLTFARKGKVEQTPLALVSFIKETAKLNRVAIPENIGLSVDYGQNLLPVMGDITQLQQMFLNLLTNARDALEGVGDAHIEVTLSDYEPDAAFRTAHPEGEGVEVYACMQVRDNGHGISPEDQEHIFDPFFTTKEVGRGTGLGLAMVYGVVQAHRGIIEVESSPGKGTCFSIYLPLDSGAVVTVAEEQKASVTRGRGETILVADDDENVLATFSKVLESINYRVLTAGNGSEALELYEKHADKIDLVILDIVMPSLKGPEVAKRIRAINPGIKLLYATGYDSQRGAGEPVRDAGVLDKPYAIEEVSRTIRQLLDS